MRRRSSNNGIIAAAALLLLIVATAAVGGASAQKAVAPAKGSSSKSSSKHGCTSVAGCKTCSKSGCTACKTGADLSGGKCYCPAGSAQYGSGGTIPLVTTNGRKLSQVAAAAASSTKAAHGKGKGSGKKGGSSGGGNGASSFACAPCDAGFYSAQSKLVGSARCVACPAGSTSDIGATTCLVPAGFYYDSASGSVKSCPANKYCAGGDFAAEGRVINPCPSGSTSPVESSELGACTVPPGSYYDPGSNKVIKCPKDSYCGGGSVAGDGLTVTPCPQGSTTASVGASELSQCVVAPGSYYDSSDQTVKPCSVNTYCPGGSVTGEGASPFDCPTDTTFPSTGASSQNQCIVAPGFYWTGTDVAQCPADKYCIGGSIGTSGSVVNNCPAGTTSPIQSDAISDCVVPAGSYYDGTKVVTCPAGSYCPGGSVADEGTIKTACPANADSLAASNEPEDCTLDPGYYCVYVEGTCAVTLCQINSYCPGGISVTDTANPGSNVCPPNSVSVAGSDAIADCKLAPGVYCSGTYAGPDGSCDSITQCPVDKYCPGGDSITDSTKPGVKNCPVNTGSVAGSDAKADCTLESGYYCIYDVNDVCSVTLCPANNYCPGGASVEDPKTPGGPIPCGPGQTSPAGSSTDSDCFTPCTDGQIFCAPTCIDPITDSKNCGACGNVCNAPESCIGGACSCGTEGNICPTGSTCKPLGLIQTPTCVCDNTGVPVSSPKSLACDVKVQNKANTVIYKLNVIPGQPYTLNYDAFGIPDRFVVTEGSPCGPILIDTSFVGLVKDGCAQSAPCCVSALGAGCTGTGSGETEVCPSSPSAIPKPGGGPGKGSVQFTPSKNEVYVVGYGVCSTTDSEFTVICPSPP